MDLGMLLASSSEKSLQDARSACVEPDKVELLSPMSTARTLDLLCLPQFEINLGGVELMINSLSLL